ncbi:MAG: mechanosensitive ion channel protein MscS [Gammaproteobacteria bacterium]|nr:MAG: mechanosensitive ion channel protein MscS [Gammaproteobacteria bacterium]
MKEWSEALAAQMAFLEPWMIQSFLVLLAFAVANFVQKRLLNRLAQKVASSANLWDDAVVSALRSPLTTLLWVIGVSLSVDIIQVEARAPVFELVDPLRKIGVIFCLIWFGIRLVRELEQAYIRERRLSDSSAITSVQALGKLARLSLFITGGLITLQTLGISISGLLAFGGIGGLAAGLAARDMLANVFGALTLYWDRPFEVGHWIRSPDREIEGVVEDIGWRLTRIRTFEKRVLYVPNSVFSNIVVENPSRMSHRRIYETIGVRYDDIRAVPAIVAAVRAMLENHPGIDQSQTLIVNFNAFGPSSLDLMVYCYTRTTIWVEYHAVKEDVLLKIADIVAAHGAEIAFPTRTVHVSGALALEQAHADAR